MGKVSSLLTVLSFVSVANGISNIEQGMLIEEESELIGRWEPALRIRSQLTVLSFLLSVWFHRTTRGGFHITLNSKRTYEFQ